MESRKVQAVGTSTLAISLPKKWASTNNVKKGSQVFITEEGDSLRVISATDAENRRAEKVPEYLINADLCTQPGMLERIVVGNYVLGRERIIVKSDVRLKSELHQEVRNVSWRLIGLGIIEETANSMSLQCSIDPSRYPLEGIMKRLYNIGITMFDEAMEALLTNDKRLAEDVIKREDDADMIYWLCLRLILSAQADESLMKKIGVKRRYEIAGNRLITKDLESIADHSEEIAQNVLALQDIKAKVSGKLLKLLENLHLKVKEVCSDSITALLARDFEKANLAIRSLEEIKKKEDRIEKLMYEVIKNPETLLCMRNIIYSIQKIAGFAQSISVVAINRYLETSTKICKAVSDEKVE